MLTKHHRFHQFAALAQIGIPQDRNPVVEDDDHTQA